MVGCVLSQLKPSGFSILSSEERLGLGPFSQLGMESSSGFFIYIYISALTLVQREP